MKKWELIAKHKNLRPLTIHEDKIICYEKGNIVAVSCDLVHKVFICSMPFDNKVKFLFSKNRQLDRIFRISPNYAVVSDRYMYILRRNEIWRCDLMSGKITLDFVIPEKRTSLGIAKIILSNGETNLLIGDYFENKTKTSVRIWRTRSSLNGWEFVNEISSNEIEHIHSLNLIGDKIFILCGDFEKAASIWISDPDFNSIKPILRGKQEFRAAWIAGINGKIYYATDTQMEQNYLCELFLSGENPSINKLSALNGSSIYCGFGQNNEIYFSTTVECGLPTGNLLYDIFDMNSGPGIFSNFASIFKLNPDGSKQEIFAAKKDFLPFRLSQFGTFIFPSGIMPSNLLITYGQALEGYDDTCLVFKSE
jgi:hypothetical protein